MKSQNFILLSLLLTSSTGLWANATADIPPIQRRIERIASAEQLLTPPAPDKSKSVIINPFAPGDSRATTTDNSDQQAAARAAALASTKSLLIALADKLEPKGTFVVGGESIILLGQKKLKVGDTYSISFDGKSYELEISAIETTRFSVRYKNEEVTRPIVISKTAK